MIIIYKYFRAHPDEDSVYVEHDESIDGMLNFFSKKCPDDLVLEYKIDDRLLMRKKPPSEYALLREKNGKYPTRLTLISHASSDFFSALDAKSMADHIIFELDEACKADPEFLELVKAGKLQIDLIGCGSGLVNLLQGNSYTKAFSDALYAAGYNITVRAYTSERGSYDSYVRLDKEMKSLSIQSFQSEFDKNEYEYYEKKCIDLYPILTNLYEHLIAIEQEQYEKLPVKSDEQKQLISKKEHYQSQYDEIKQEYQTFMQRMNSHVKTTEIDHPRKYLDRNIECLHQSRAEYLREIKDLKNTIEINDRFIQKLFVILKNHEKNQMIELKKEISNFLQTKEELDINQLLDKLFLHFEVSHLEFDLIGKSTEKIINVIIKIIEHNQEQIKSKIQNMQEKLTAIEAEHRIGLTIRSKQWGITLDVSSDVKDKITIKEGFLHQLAKDNKEKQDQKEPELSQDQAASKLKQNKPEDGSSDGDSLPITPTRS